MSDLDQFKLWLPFVKEDAQKPCEYPDPIFTCKMMNLPLVECCGPCQAENLLREFTHMMFQKGQPQ